MRVIAPYNGTIYSTDLYVSHNPTPDIHLSKTPLYGLSGFELDIYTAGHSKCPTV